MQSGQGAKAYAKTHVSTTTSQQQLIVMAYDGILRFIKLAKTHMAAGEIEPTHLNLQKARAVVQELAATLNREAGGQIAENLWNLYVFFMQKITQANFTKNPQHLDDIIPSIKELRDGWAKMEVPKGDVKAQAANKNTHADSKSHVSITG